MRKKINTGVTLGPDVLAYLTKLGKREDRDRSWLINSIVREHAGRQGSGHGNATRHIALFTELDLFNPQLSRFFPYVFGELKRYFKAAGYQTRFYTDERMPQSDLDHPRVYDELMADVADGKVCGVVNICALPRQTSELIGRLSLRGVPIIADAAAFPYAVLFPYRLWISTAIRHLVAQGRRRLALVGWSVDEFSTLFREELAAQDLPCRAEWIRDDIHPNKRGAGWSELREVWTAHMEKPDGLIVTDDMLVPDACAAIQELGIRAPDQLMIVAHANKGCPYATPLPVTKLEYDSDAHVRALGEMMLALLRGEPVTQPHVCAEDRFAIQPPVSDAPRPPANAALHRET